MTFTYTPQRPSRQLVNHMAAQAIKDRMPTGYQWPEEGAAETDHELGKLLSALAQVTADWLYQIQQLKTGTPLAWARKGWLDRIGDGLRMPRYTDELDQDYAERLQSRLTADRITADSIEQALLRLYPRVTFFEPWRQLEHASCGLTLSGNQPLPSRNYWNAGVFQANLYVLSGDLHPETTSVLDAFKDAGSKYWLTMYHPAQVIDWNNDPLIAEDEYDTIVGHDGTELWDPRTSKRDQRVVVASSSETVSLYPQDEIQIYATFTEILSLMARSAPLTCGALFPIAMLDSDDPDFVGSPYEVPDDVDPDDLEPNFVYGVDWESSNGTSVGQVLRELFLCNTRYSDFQAGVVLAEID